MTKIYSTKDYAQFKKINFNRDLHQGNLKKLIFSIQTRNLLDLRPIIVNKEMQVIDGQHRLEAARTLNVPIYYQIDETSNEKDIIILNANQRAWDIEDYIHFHQQQGNDHYKRLIEFQKKVNLPLASLIRFLKRSSFYKGYSKKMMQVVREGHFIFLEEEEEKKLLEDFHSMEEVLEIMRCFAIGSKAFLDTIRLKMAIMSFLEDPNVEVEVFKYKIKIRSELLRPLSTSSLYMQVFYAIYNYRNKNPIGSSPVNEI